MVMKRVDEPTTRHLAWEACFNARDCGGLPTVYGRTRWKALVRADNSSRLTPSGRTALVAYGVRTVIDLRDDYELQMEPSPFSLPSNGKAEVTYVHQPLIDPTNLRGRAALASARNLGEDAIMIVEYFPTSIATIVTTFAQAQAGGVLIHCHAGKDRTGVTTSLMLSLAGGDDATIADDYATSTARLRPLYDALVLRGMIQAGSWMEAVPETMHALLEHLRSRYGGTAPYLRYAGVTPEALRQARARLAQEARKGSPTH